MKQILLRGGLPIMATVALTGCIDDNYDLSDIDTTSEFKVKDLVLPINMDKVLLGDIINIKEGDQIKEITINGELYDHHDADGFINLFGLPLKVRAMKMQETDV